MGSSSLFRAFLFSDGPQEGAELWQGWWGSPHTAHLLTSLYQHLFQQLVLFPLSVAERQAPGSIISLRCWYPGPGRADVITPVLQVKKNPSWS